MSLLTLKSILIFAITIAFGNVLAVAQQVENKPVESAQTENDDAKQLDEFLTGLALDSMPVRYVEDKDWGKQKERWDGVKVSFKNGRLRTKRRKKLVNHGTWDRYEVSLVDPENSFAVQLNNASALKGLPK